MSSAPVEFLVRMEVTGVADLDPGELDRLRAAEALRAAELAATGTLLRVWRPAGGGWRNVGLWTAGDEGELRATLATLPFAPYLRIEVEPLETHPNDPGR
ncbi:MAG: muconolactone Delta-isomerase family protein [Nocardioides alkalitolerans]